MAKKRVEDVIAEVQEAGFRLEHFPETMLEHVNYLNFLDSFVERMEEIYHVSNSIVDLHSLISTYKVPTSPEDLAVYQVPTLFCSCVIGITLKVCHKKTGDNFTALTCLLD